MATNKKSDTPAGSARASSTAAKKPRSEAQRAAARRNGSKGRGPVTAAGKARSRLNAVKHGLLAKAITPRTDLRGDDALYRANRANLLEEFPARGAAVELAINLVASDLVQLARVRQMREAQMRARPDADLERKAQESLTDARRAAAVQSCHAALAAGPDPLATTAVAQPAAELVADALEDLLARVKADEEVDAENAADEADVDAYPARAAACEAKSAAAAEAVEIRTSGYARPAPETGGPAAATSPAGAAVPDAGTGGDGGFDHQAEAEEDDEFELQFAAQRKAARDAVTPIRAEIADRAAVVARLTGRSGLSASDRPAWVAALAHLARELNSRHRRAEADKTGEAYRRAVEHHHYGLAEKLPTLEALLRYERKLRRDVDRGLARLAKG